jgi:hypothetical protein
MPSGLRAVLQASAGACSQIVTRLQHGPLTGKFIMAAPPERGRDNAWRKR